MICPFFPNRLNIWDVNGETNFVETQTSSLWLLTWVISFLARGIINSLFLVIQRHIHTFNSGRRMRWSSNITSADVDLTIICFTFLKSWESRPLVGSRRSTLRIISPSLYIKNWKMKSKDKTKKQKQPAYLKLQTFAKGND